MIVNEEVVALLESSAAKQHIVIDNVEVEVLFSQEGIRKDYDVIIIMSFHIRAMKKLLMALGVHRLCGVFSAMNMFAEISFPTSVVLAVDRKNVVLLNDTDFQGIVEWGEERESREVRYQHKLELLYENWEDKNLFIHPVKLSRWK